MLRRQAGGGLLEVLVAITVSSMGLLALAGSHLHALRQSTALEHRMLAAWLVSDLGERMRASGADGTSANAYEFSGLDFSDQAAAPPAPSILCAQPTHTCTLAEMAAADLHVWRVRVRAQLPEGSGFVLPDANAGGAVDIWVAWVEPLAANPDEVQRAGGDRECPAGLAADNHSAVVRCHSLRVQL